MKRLRILTSQLYNILLGATVCSLLACASDQVTGQPPVQSSSGALPTLWIGMTATPAIEPSTQPPSPLPSLEPLQGTQRLMFTSKRGVTLHHPKDWLIRYIEPPENIPEFEEFTVRTPDLSGGAQVIVRSTPRAEESSLYHYAGEMIETKQRGPYKTLWDQQLIRKNRNYSGCVKLDRHLPHHDGPFIV